MRDGDPAQPRPWSTGFCGTGLTPGLTPSLTPGPDRKMKFSFLTLCLYIFGICAGITYGAECGQSEYLSVSGECCPLCKKGFMVLKNCSEHYSTTCKPCSKGTFMNEPNGLPNCFQCKTCDTGLYILQGCSSIKDTVCEVMDGYYCIRYSDKRRNCLHAMKHSECKPGQQIKTPGTKASDTVCELCPPGFYSPEGVNCSKWTDCSVKNETEDQEGTSIRDVQCKARERNRYGLIAAFVTVPLLSAIVLYLNHKSAVKGCRTLNTVKKTDSQISECMASSSQSQPQMSCPRTFG